MTTEPALLLVAHGSRDPRHAVTMSAIADGLRAALPDTAVSLAYLELTAPLLEEELARLLDWGVEDAVVVPLLLTAAYHSGTDLPGRLTGKPRTTVTPVLGPHPLLVRALERRLAEAGVDHGDPDVAVVLAAAGSSAPQAAATVEGIAHTMASAGWWAVRPAYASAAPPTVDVAVAALRADGAPRVAVARYFLAPGFLPDAIGDGAYDADIVTEPLGAAPEVVQVVVERYATATGR